jgi:hypothetical protein
VWKDSYVFVYGCRLDTMIAHPMRPDLVRRAVMQIKAAIRFRIAAGLSFQRHSGLFLSSSRALWSPDERLHCRLGLARICQRHCD